ncbi:MAG: 16S rRNA (cytosine(967)-C(5))-methyltransferase RsmB [Xanthomonadales bacterium]|nr:16S rRNA (cytosine(967)-C(5))-methyltransferase RsmB [Xanthomonadales bacterium]
MSDSAAARLLAVRTLGSVLDDGQSLTEALRATGQPDDRERAFAAHLAYGVLRWKSALEWLAGALLKRPLKRRDRDVQRLILVGLFQLHFEDAPEYAVIHACAETTRTMRKAWATGLINAVLRRYQREREALDSRLADTDQAHAHPRWLLDLLRQDWPEHWASIVEANNRAAPMWLRVNQQRITKDDAKSLLEKEGFTTQEHEEAAQALAISPAAPTHGIPGFDNGLFSVQDPAAQLAASWLDAAPGDRLLDACAAPGGKTGHLLERTPKVVLTALDRDAARVELVEQNLARLDLAAQLMAADATEPGSWWDGRPFDRILLDAPCSATGVIRRHPEIKWLRTPEQLDRAVEDQRTLLDALWPLLKPGGILVYATCSVLRRENHQQIHGFLSRHPDARECSPPPFEGSGRQILPGEEDMDGFYYARLCKPA